MNRAFVLTALAVVVLLCAVGLVTDPFDWRGPDAPPDTNPSPITMADAPEDAPAGPALRGTGEPVRGEAPAPSPETATPVQAPPTEARLSGRVVDAEGRPVSKALVWLDRPVPPFDAASTDAKGRYEVPAVPGAHTVCARGSGTATSRVDVGAEARARVAVPDLVLTRGGVIRGRVVDADGKPAPFVRVRCWAENKDHAGELGRGGTRYLVGGDDVATKDDGLFELKGLEMERHRVYVDLALAPTLRAEPKAYEGIEPGGESLTFRILPKFAVAGRVVDAATGEPVSSFQVNNRIVKDPEGRFGIAAGKGGRVKITARGYLPYVRDDLALREGESAHRLLIELEPDPETGTVLIVATDPNEQPVTGWTARGFGPNFVFWEAACEAADGRLRVRGLKAGKQTLWFRGSGLSDAKAEATVEAGSEVEVAVRFRRGGAVRLKILDGDGAVVRYAKVRLLDAKGNGVAFRFAYAEPQGTSIISTEVSSFGKGDTTLSLGDGTLEGVGAGTYTLRVVVGGSTFDAALEVPPSGSIEKTIRRSN